jgi:hypothetical protein
VQAAISSCALTAVERLERTDYGEGFSSFLSLLFLPSCCSVHLLRCTAGTTIPCWRCSASLGCHCQLCNGKTVFLSCWYPLRLLTFSPSTCSASPVARTLRQSHSVQVAGRAQANLAKPTTSETRVNRFNKKSLRSHQLFTSLSVCWTKWLQTSQLSSVSVLNVKLSNKTGGNMMTSFTTTLSPWGPRPLSHSTNCSLLHSSTFDSLLPFCSPPLSFFSPLH